MSKYRIVEETRGDGSRKYIPQYRSLFIWWNFTQTDAWCMSEFSVEFDSKLDAEVYINGWKAKDTVSKRVV